MGFKAVASLDCDVSTALGGYTDKTKKTLNPTQAEGYYLGTKVTTGGKFGDSNLHILQTPEGNIGIWGKTDLDRKIKAVKPGTMVRLTATDERRPSNKGNDMHVFLVEEDQDNRIEVPEYSQESKTGTETAPQEQEEQEESDPAAEAAPAPDVVKTAKVTKPAAAAKAPDAARAAQVRSLLGSKSKSA